MTVKFKNPPIVELVAEVHWNTGVGPSVFNLQPGIQVSVPPNSNPDLEAFFSRFGLALNELNFRNSERLVPVGFPVNAGQVVYRYRSSDDPDILVQAGWGVATINGLPNYGSWKAFAPKLKSVLAALIAARDPGEASSDFYSASVRYINGFGPDFIGDSNAASFTRDVLGFQVQTSEAISSAQPDNDAPQVNLQMAFATADGLQARVSVGEGLAQGQPAVMLDFTVGVSEPVASDLDSITKALDDAHTVIHNMFVGSTAALTDVMQPEAEE
jgi:uncharacterized protein (TIGR04255 family)